MADQALRQQLARGFRRKHSTVNEKVIDPVQTRLRATRETNHRHAVFHRHFQSPPGAILKQSPPVADADHADRLVLLLELSDPQHHVKFGGSIA
jgi:hypothetical protein